MNVYCRSRQASINVCCMFDFFISPSLTLTHPFPELLSPSLQRPCSFFYFSVFGVYVSACVLCMCVCLMLLCPCWLCSNGISWNSQSPFWKKQKIYCLWEKERTWVSDLLEVLCFRLHFTTTQKTQLLDNTHIITQSLNRPVFFPFHWKKITVVKISICHFALWQPTSRREGTYFFRTSIFLILKT